LCIVSPTIARANARTPARMKNSGKGRNSRQPKLPEIRETTRAERAAEEAIAFDFAAASYFEGAKRKAPRPARSKPKAAPQAASTHRIEREARGNPPQQMVWEFPNGTDTRSGRRKQPPSRPAYPRRNTDIFSPCVPRFASSSKRTPNSPQRAPRQRGRWRGGRKTPTSGEAKSS